MVTLQIHSICPIPGDTCYCYCGMAFDGCHYYLTLPKQSCIHILSCNFCMESQILTCRPYCAIYCDPYTRGFWAAALHEPGRIYHLDQNLNEDGQITIRGCERPDGELVGLSCGTTPDTLLIAYEYGLIELCKQSGSVSMQSRTCHSRNTAVACIPCMYLISTEDCNCECFNLHCCNGKQVIRCGVPDGYHVCSAVACGEDEFCVLVRNRSSCRCILCLRICDDECHPEPPEPPCEDGCNRLLCAIALTQASIAHILNAEGEKIQRVVEEGDVCCLLHINNCVRRTINEITLLEHQLVNKLEALHDICPPESKKEIF